MTNYPPETWGEKRPEDMGVSSAGLDAAHTTYQEKANGEPYRVVVVRDGFVIAEWNSGLSTEKRIKIASATKSVLSCALGIAIEEGQINSVKSKICDYYPEALQVLPGEGPKENRHARSKDRDISFEHLISNTSGYLKPDEFPGKTFHYQTFGMNILGHAIAKQYGFWDSSKPKKSRDVFQLYDSRLRIPLGAKWKYRHENFEMQENARLGIFGYNGWIESSTRDMARLGWLWCNEGQWRGEQLVPASWIRQATKTASTITENCAEEMWKYGYGFWTNDNNQAWPNLPSDSFAARGRGAESGNHHIWVWPKEDLVVAQGPGVENRGDMLGQGLLGDIVKTIK